jgi:hypothetical protein
VVGRIFKAHAAPQGTPWMWTLAFEHHEDRTPTHGYAATREAAMTAFAKSWRQRGLGGLSAPSHLPDEALKAGDSLSQLLGRPLAGLDDKYRHVQGDAADGGRH